MASSRKLTPDVGDAIQSKPKPKGHTNTARLPRFPLARTTHHDYLAMYLGRSIRHGNVLRRMGKNTAHTA